MQCMGMAGLTVDKGNMVFSTNAEDSRDRRCIVRMVAEVNGDAEQYLTRVAEGLLPHGMALPFSLPQIGGFSFGPGAGKKVNITRLPWGGARSKVAAYVRGADLLSNHHNTSRNKQETDGSRHNTAPPGAKTSLCGFVFWKVRRILLRLRQKISPIEAKERKLWSFEEGQSISSLESRQAWTRPEPQSLGFAVS